MSGSTTASRAEGFIQSIGVNQHIGYFGTVYSNVTLELQDSVHHMLQDLRSGNTTIFGDMPYQEYWCLRVLGKTLKLRRTFPDLGDTARGRFDIGRLQRLNRVYDDKTRL